MDFVTLAELGAQVTLDAILLWLVVRYLPRRDMLFMEEMKRHSRQLNRLVQAFILILDDEGKRRQNLSDEIFRDTDADADEAVKRSKRRREDFFSNLSGSDDDDL